MNVNADLRRARFMSDNWIILIPDDPTLVPEPARQKAAAAHLRRIAPEGEVRTEASDSIKFIDCGSNFESVHCPYCDASIEMGWWGDRMSDDYDKGFRLSPLTMPCCSKQASLNDLSYERPQAFGRFVLEVMN